MAVQKPLGDITAWVEQRVKDAVDIVEESQTKEPIPREFIRECLVNNVQGDAEIFKKLVNKYYVFNSAMGVWFFWTGAHWEIDKIGRAMADVSCVADVYKVEAKKRNSELKNTDKKDPIKRSEIKMNKDLNSRAFSLLDIPRAKRVLEMAASGPTGLNIRGDEIDQKPWLLAVQNGVIDLKAGDIRPGRRTDYLLKCSPVTWAGIDEPAPVFIDTLNHVFNGRQDLIDFFQRCIGLSLIGMNVSSKLIVLVGQGRNGKSKLMELFCKALGELSGSIRSEMLLDSNRFSNPSGPSPEIMALRGVRLVTASETDENCRVSTARIKWLTGGDTLVARGPHDKYEVQFLPTHTLFLLTNHKPHAPADDFAFWERVILIPFENSYVDREPTAENEYRADPNLSEKLEAELPGVLAWMVRGCLLFQKIGLNPPPIVTNAVSEYRQDEDVVGDFIEACCVVGDGYHVAAGAVYQVFEEWWKKNISNKIPKQKRFGTMFSRRFEKRKTPNVTYIGVKLAENPLID